MPFESREQDQIAGKIIRGGTSKGLFVLESSFPTTGYSRDEFVLELFGSPDPLQLDGIGGSHSHTSKLMVVAPSERDEVDVDYTFAQVGVDRPVVDYGGNCGNLTSAVGVFALLEGLVEPLDPATRLTLYNTNTDTTIDQTVPVSRGEPAVYGEYSIDGVAGTGASIDSEFLDPAGGVTGSLLPTGRESEYVDVGDRSVEVSIVDVANPNVFVRADDLGYDGTMLPAEMEASPELLDALETIRSVACERIGLVDDAANATEASPAVPYVAMVAPPQSYECSNEGRVDAADIDVTARMLSNQSPHHAYAMTGSMCLAAATQIPGTVPFECVRNQPDRSAVSIGHPKGTITVGVAVDRSGSDPRITSVTVRRTARLLVDGAMYYRVAERASE